MYFESAYSDLILNVLGLVTVAIALFLTACVACKRGERRGMAAGIDKGHKRGLETGKTIGEQIGRQAGLIEGSDLVSKRLTDATAKITELENSFSDKISEVVALKKTIAGQKKMLDTEIHTHKREIENIKKDNSITIADALTIDETADALGVDPKTLYRWRQTGKNLRWYKFNGLVLYKRDDVDAYLDKITAPTNRSAA